MASKNRYQVVTTSDASILYDLDLYGERVGEFKDEEFAKHVADLLNEEQETVISDATKEMFRPDLGEAGA